MDDGKGGMKKGKRFGFDRFNNLSCKMCRKTFHKHQALEFHISDEHDGQLNTSMTSRNNRSDPAKRIYSEKSMKYCRVNLRPVSYDDDVEILDVPTPSSD